MRYILISLILTIYAEAVAQNPQKEPSRKLQGFHHPESVIFDEEQEVFFVSNMAGKKERDGFISKLSSEGEILDTLWVSGLQDPKGLLIQQGKLFVTDVTFLVEIDLKTGKILQKTAVEKAESLNDITADEKGNIYFSDLKGNRIYMADTAGNISEWLTSPDLERPNGLLVSEKDIFVASWGKEEPGHLLKVDQQTKEIQKVTRQGIGNLDGLQQITPDGFYISDWATGDIYRINTDGSKKKVVESEKSSGDILFLKNTSELVLPMNHQNEIWWYGID